MGSTLLRRPRSLAGAAALLCAAALATGLFMQHVLGFQPCSLCVFQRLAYVLALGAALSILLARGRSARLAATAALLVFAAGGLGVAAYQVWLQAFPPAMTACSAGLGVYFDGLPLETVLHWVFDAEGDCGVPTYFIGKVTLAQAGFAGFVLLLGAALQLARVTPRRRGS